jgi:hypothetical protein
LDVFPEGLNAQVRHGFMDDKIIWNSFSHYLCSLNNERLDLDPNPESPENPDPVTVILDEQYYEDDCFFYLE